MLNNLSGRQLVYLVLAIGGAIGTWYFNLQMEDLSLFFTSVWDTPLTSSLMVDLLVVVLTFYFFMLTEGTRAGVSIWIIVLLILLTGMVAVAFSFPMFMFFRERALAKTV